MAPPAQALPPIGRRMAVPSGADGPLTTLCPCPPSWAYPFLRISLCIPLGGYATGAPRLALFHCSVSGQHRGPQAALAVGPVRPGGHPIPAVGTLSPTAAFRPPAFSGVPNRGGCLGSDLTPTPPLTFRALGGGSLGGGGFFFKKKRTHWWSGPKTQTWGRPGGLGGGVKG